MLRRRLFEARSSWSRRSERASPRSRAEFASVADARRRAGVAARFSAAEVNRVPREMGAGGAREELEEGVGVEEGCAGSPKASGEGRGSESRARGELASVRGWPPSGCTEEGGEARGCDGAARKKKSAGGEKAPLRRAAIKGESGAHKRGTFVGGTMSEEERLLSKKLKIIPESEIQEQTERLRRVLKIGPRTEAKIRSQEKKQLRYVEKYVEEFDCDQLLVGPRECAATWRGTFRDPRGECDLKIEVTGTEMSLKVRGVRFSGRDLLDWSIENEAVNRVVAEAKFDLWIPPPGRLYTQSTGGGSSSRRLDKFELEFAIPVEVVAARAEGEQEEAIDARICVEAGRCSGGRDKLAIELRVGDQVHRPDASGSDESGRAVSFDEQMRQISAKLPPRHCLRACWSCAFSQYSPAEKAPFGSMACFRDWPRITDARNPLEIIRNWSRHSGYTQETHLCGSFKCRAIPRAESESFRE